MEFRQFNNDGGHSDRGHHNEGHYGPDGRLLVHLPVVTSGQT